MIDGVLIKPLKVIADPRGDIQHFLRLDDGYFQAFGETYFSFVNGGAVKAWRKHTRSFMQLAVPVGAIRIVLFDDRPSSPTNGQLQVHTLGVDADASYDLLVVPPGVWNGFQGISASASLLVNCSSIPHDPDEAERLDADDPSIPHTWASD